METKQVHCCLAAGLMIYIWEWMDFGWRDEEMCRKPCRQELFHKAGRLGRKSEGREENASHWLFFVPEGKRGASYRHLQEPSVIPSPLIVTKTHHDRMRETQLWDGRWPDWWQGSAAPCFPVDALSFGQKNLFFTSFPIMKAPNEEEKRK